VSQHVDTRLWVDLMPDRPRGVYVVDRRDRRHPIKRLTREQVARLALWWVHWNHQPDVAVPQT
jgi:hypothetical protein